MTNFDTLCQVFEEMDNDTYNDLINQKSADVLRALIDITEDEMDGVSIFADFVMCAVAADGKLSEEEFLFLKPSLDLILGKDATYGDAQKIFYDNGLDKPKDYKRAMDHMVDVIGEVNPALKDDIVLLCLMICAVDGRVSEKEKRWIRNLIE